MQRRRDAVQDIYGIKYCLSKQTTYSKLKTNIRSLKWWDIMHNLSKSMKE